MSKKPSCVISDHMSKFNFEFKIFIQGIKGIFICVVKISVFYYFTYFCQIIIDFSYIFS